MKSCLKYSISNLPASVPYKIRPIILEGSAVGLQCSPLVKFVTASTPSLSGPHGRIQQGLMGRETVTGYRFYLSLPVSLGLILLVSVQRIKGP